MEALDLTVSKNRLLVIRYGAENNLLRNRKPILDFALKFHPQLVCERKDKCFFALSNVGTHGSGILVLAAPLSP